MGTWIAEERRNYADLKYADESAPRHRAILDMQNFGLDEHGEWRTFITTYLRRAQLFGLDTPQGQQAFGKFIVTALHCFETSVVVNGKPPMPGVASGEIREWVQTNA